MRSLFLLAITLAWTASAAAQPPTEQAPATPDADSGVDSDADPAPSDVDSAEPSEPEPESDPDAADGDRSTVERIEAEPTAEPPEQTDAPVAAEAAPGEPAAAEANPFAQPEPEAEVEDPNDDLPPALQVQEEERSWVSVEAPDPVAPLRVVARLGLGLGFRLNARDDFQQSTLAPAFLSAAGGVVLPGRGRLRHQVTLGVSANLNQDGTYPSGVEPFEQWTLTPSYAARFALEDSPVPFVLLSARVGVPITLAPSVTVGGEVALGAQLNFLAGFGAYAELVYDFYFGGARRGSESSVHHVMALEVGAQIDFEVLQ